MKTGPMKKICSVLMAGMLCITAAGALADNAAVEVNGSVINIAETPVTTSYTGTIAALNVREGSYVNEGDILATLKTTKVYAAENGIVHLFGDVGDSTEMVTDHYGAVAYIEPEIVFTISASTRYSYEDESCRVIHPGEKVYLRAYNNRNHYGIGVVTQVSGTTFVVDVLEGIFEGDESVSVYRDRDYSNTQRIGRGNTARTEYSAYEGSGVIVSYAVTEGSEVKKGDVLFETIDGVYAGPRNDLTVIKATANGVITGTAVSLGAAVTAEDTICTLAPDEALRVEAEVEEESLSAFPVGSRVTVYFTYVGNGDYSVGGVVEQVSAFGYADQSGENEQSFYKAIVKLDDITGISYGMNVTVVNN